MTPQSIIKLISNAAPYFEHLSWLASYVSSKNRMYANNLALYFHDFRPKKYPHRVILLLKTLLWATREIYRTQLCKQLFYRKVQEFEVLTKQRNFFVIKTFAYKSSMAQGHFSDPFFKDLIPSLRSQGHEILFIVDSLTSWNELLRCKECAIPYQYFYSPFEIVSSLLALLKESWKYPTKEVRRYQSLGAKERGVAELYHMELYNPQTLINYLFYFVGKNSARLFPAAKAFFYTYENNSWERTFSYGIKSASSSNIVNALQHAVMPEASLNMYIGETEKDYVDFTDNIFTTGQYPEELFKKYSSVSMEKFKRLGTTRFNYLHQVEPVSLQRDSNYDFLIALEGVYQAAEVIERFHQECCKMNKKPRTLLRLHPAFGIEKMQKYLSFDIQIAGYIEISKSPSVLDDLKISNLLIYWGSTCSLEALMLGKPVIHCKLPSVLDFDPLGEYAETRYVWDKGQSLFDIQTQALSEVSESKMLKGRTFVNNYFQRLQITDSLFYQSPNLRTP